MNTQELKSLMIEKDNEVKLREEKTIEYFNLVKDDVISEIIKRFILSEFHGDISNRTIERIAIDILYRKLGINTEGFVWDNSLCFKAWRHIRYTPYFLAYHVGFHPPNGKDMIENYNKTNVIKDSFDYEVFGGLIEKYVLSKGFKNRVITNIHGQRVNSRFSASRKHVEMLINNPDYIAACNKPKKDNLPNLFYLLPVILFIFALALYFICK